MKKSIAIFLFFLLYHLLLSQPKSNAVSEKKFDPKETTIYYKLGNSTIQLKTFQYGETRGFVMINLHSDEITSVAAAHELLLTNGGLLIKIENVHKRNIRFRLGNRNFIFDPNNIFSREGITKSLKEHGNINNEAVHEVEKFADRILQLIPENPSCIIALHNNTDGQYSITSYLPGNTRETDARKVYVNPLQDADDIFLTTDSILFQQLAGEKYNCILQDNEMAIKDGSLSVYCGEKKLRYLNCETQHGKKEQYLDMLMAAKNYIERISPNAVMYSCKLVVPNGEYIATPNEIYFGEKKVGTLKSLTGPDSLNTLIGKLEILKNFKLYSNTDFFLFNYPNGKSKIEIRIDPTREKKLLDLRKDVVEISIKNIDWKQKMD